MADIDVRQIAGSMGISLTFAPGSIIFDAGHPASCFYVVQSGAVEILLHDKVVDTCGPNDAMGILAVVDGGLHVMSARVRDTAVVSAIDSRKFDFMVDEVPYFAKYVMGMMARRMRELGKVI